MDPPEYSPPLTDPPVILYSPLNMPPRMVPLPFPFMIPPLILFLVHVQSINSTFDISKSPDKVAPSISKSPVMTHPVKVADLISASLMTRTSRPLELPFDRSELVGDGLLDMFVVWCFR